MKAKIYSYRKWIKETNPKVLKKQMGRILKESGFTLLGFKEHHFKPQGYSAIWLLAESHFAIHTFPEEGKSYTELSSCTKEYYNIFKKSI